MAYATGSSQAVASSSLMVSGLASENVSGQRNIFSSFVGVAAAMRVGTYSMISMSSFQSRSFSFDFQKGAGEHTASLLEMRRHILARGLYRTGLPTPPVFA